MNHANGKLIRFWKKGRVLCHGHAPTGHHSVTLVGEDGAHTTLAVHRLVLLAHVGPPPSGKPFGLHRDDDPHNNALHNLCWGDRPANSYDSVRNGNHVQARKEACPLGHKLVEPNLVPSSSKNGYRGCLACKKTQASHYGDARRLARGPGMRGARGPYRTRDGFQRRTGESFKDEADRRYAHIMGRHSG